MTVTRPQYNAYRFLALTVGVLLVISTIGSLMKYLLPEGGSLQKLGENMGILWVGHGWFYMAYVVIALVIARRSRWSPQQVLVLFVAGLVPLLMFFVEHKVSRRIVAENPELA